MNRDVLPSSEPDPRRPSLESLEEKLRALPLLVVPEGLPSKLVAAIPPTKAASSLGSGILRHWLWIGAAAVICISVSAVVYSWLTHSNSKPPAGANEIRNATDSSTTEKAMPGYSKAVSDWERAVRFDPYNAEAWFSLAKAQKDAHRSADAISSARKAIDIARSRNRSDLVNTIDSWLRSYRATQSGQLPP